VLTPADFDFYEAESGSDDESADEQ